MRAALSVLVLGDSTAFADQTGPQLPDTPHLYPNVAARHLEERLDRAVEVTVVAQPGATVRDALRAATKDRHVQFDLLAHADAVVIGVGSFDHAPAGIPPSVQAIVPFLRPDGLRRQVRRTLHAAYPRVIHLRRGRGSRTPPREFQRLYGALLDQVRSITWGRAAGAALGPTSHRSAYYGHRHPGHALAEARQLAQARAHGYAPVAVWPRVAPHLDALNDDGIHWPAPVHALIGADVAAALLPQLTGQAPTTGLPAVYRDHLERHAADSGDG